MKRLIPLLVLIAGCGAQSPYKTVFPTATMTLGGKPFTMEIAGDSEQWEIGLTRRDSLRGDHGMVFFFHDVASRSVSGHDIRFPIDAIFLDHDGRVTGIATAPAYSDSPTAPVDALFVIELNAGTAAALNLKVGDQVGTPTLPTTQMTIGGKPFTIEEATTDSEGEFGLMARPTLPADHGMIFAFPQEKPEQFWNPDVHFALDVIFLDSAGKISAIRHMKAMDPTLTDPATCRYAIELNEGTAAALNLHVGDQLTIPADVRMQQ